MGNEFITTNSVTIMGVKGFVNGWLRHLHLLLLCCCKKRSFKRFEEKGCY
jgi:hypothetical protein